VNAVPVGNDIVDLADAGEPSPRFLARVLAPAERRRARDATAVWRLWAAKEAAYKLLARDGGALPFAHRLFAVDVDAGLVRHPRGEVRVRWQEPAAGAVGCVAWRGPDEPVSATADLAEVGGEPSAGVRLLCRRLLAGRLGIDVAELEIVRPGGGPPASRRRGRPMPGVEISLSHDGRYVACAATIEGGPHAAP
jgi:phosphopantetheinyl transferase (holo-ACP synthase)